MTNTPALSSRIPSSGARPFSLWQSAGATLAGLQDKQAAGSLSLAATVLVWASYYPVVEILVRSWDALSLSVARLGLAGLLLSGLLYRAEGARAFTGIPWRRLFFLGFFGLAAFMVLTPIGIAHSSGASAALVTAANPALAALLARGLYGEPIARDTRTAVVVSLLGGVLVVMGSGGGLGMPGLGELAVLLANGCWLWASITSQRWFAGSSQLRISTLSCVSGMLGLTVVTAVAAASGFFEFRVAGTASSWGLMAFSAVGSCAAGLVLWNFGVSRLGISTASIYANLVPVVAVLIALSLGQSVSSLQLLGGGVIVVGVLWAQLGQEGFSRLVRRVTLTRPPLTVPPPPPR